jgi:predicted DNA-binding transcriptional regulator AlpA
VASVETVATDETLIRVEEAARLAGCSRAHVYRLARRAPWAVRVGDGGRGPVRVIRAEFERWLLGDPEEGSA